MTGRLRVVVSVIAAFGLVVGVAPLPAWAAIVITAKVRAQVNLDPATCTTSAVVLTSADFSENVKVDSAAVEFSGEGGAPLGKSADHTFSGGTTSDMFVFGFESGYFKPGYYEVTTNWLAHNGNGLSRASGKAISTLLVPPFPTAGKMDSASKCGLDQTAADYRHAALTFSAAAYKNRSGCAKCANAMSGLADLTAEYAYLAERLANDPPDPDFMTLPVAMPPAVVTVTAGSGMSADAASALNGVQTQLADAVGQARAALAAVERAQGAHDAADKTWEERQSLAAAGFFTALAARLESLPGALDAAAAQLKTAGFPNPTIDAAAVQATVAPLLATDLPVRPGYTPADMTAIQTGYGLAANDLAVPVAALDSFHFDHAAVAAALKADAAALIADPLLTHTMSPSAPPSPSLSPTPTLPASPTTAELPSLLANSGFEAPALEGAAFQTLTAGKGPTLEGWILKKGSVDVVTAGGGLAATGGQFIDLNGNDTVAGPGVITQKVKVSSGHNYRLSFQMAGNPNGEPVVKTLEVSLGSKKKTLTFDTTGHTNDDLGWTTFTLAATAGCGDSTMTVTFTSKTDGNRGPNIDNVVLEDLGGTSCSAFPIWWVVAGAVVAILAAGGVYVLVRRSRRTGAPAAPTTPPAGPAAEPAD